MSSTTTTASERRYAIYFRVNEQNPFPVTDLTISQYVHLKQSAEEAYKHVWQLIKQNKVYVEGGEIRVLYRSINNVDYTRIALPAVMPSWASCVDTVCSPSSSRPNLAIQEAPSITVNRSETTATEPVENNADNSTTATSSSQLLQSNPAQSQNKLPSQVWKHFKKEGNAAARCTFCNKVFKHGGNTSNLMQHLNRKHTLLCSPITSNLRRKSTASDSGSDNVDADDPPPLKRMKFPAKVRQLTRIDEAFERVNSFGTGGETADRITNSIMFMIAVDEMPLSTVENVGFQRFVKTVAPLYQVPSRRSITKLLDAKYDLLKERFKDKIRKIASYSLTCDNWTDISNQSYLGVSLHYLSADLKMTSCCIGVFPLYSNHTSNYLVGAFNSVIEDFNLDVSKISAVVSDSAANIKKAVIEIVGASRQLACFAHIVSHLVPDALINMPEARALIAKVRSITTIVRRSVVASDESKRLQIRDGRSEGTVLKFLQDVPTRWNSTLDMMERFLKLEEYVYPVISKCNHPPDMLNRDEMNILKELVSMMKPVRFVISELSGDSYPTCSIVIPIIRCMRAAVVNTNIESQIGTNFKENLCAAIDNRFKDFEFNPVLSMATILDPRFKKMHFERAMAAAAAITRINDSLRRTIVQRRPPEEEQPAQHDRTVEQSVWGFHDNLIARNPDIASHTEATNLEMRQYLSQPVIPRTDDPFKHWRSIQQAFPSLYHLAMQYVSVVGTSVASERMFSQASHIKSDRRCRLLGERLNRLLFLSSFTAEDWGMV